MRFPAVLKALGLLNGTFAMESVFSIGRSGILDNSFYLKCFYGNFLKLF